MSVHCIIIKSKSSTFHPTMCEQGKTQVTLKYPQMRSEKLLPTYNCHYASVSSIYAVANKSPTQHEYRPTYTEQIATYTMVLSRIHADRTKFHPLRQSSNLCRGNAPDWKGVNHVDVNKMSQTAIPPLPQADYKCQTQQYIRSNVTQQHTCYSSAQHMELLELNDQCLFIIIQYLCIHRQALVARCCKRLRGLALSEPSFRTYVHCTFPDICYKDIYATTRSWRYTAQYLAETAYPVRYMVTSILPICIRGIIHALPWEEIQLTEETVQEEGSGMAECYNKIYTQLMTDNPDKSHKLNRLMFPAWCSEGGKTYLWQIPTRNHAEGGLCTNMGIAVRLVIQAFINIYAGLIANRTMDKLKVKRALPSVRNLLHQVLVINTMRGK